MPPLHIVVAFYYLASIARIIGGLAQLRSDVARLWRPLRLRRELRQRWDFRFGRRLIWHGLIRRLVVPAFDRAFYRRNMLVVPSCPWDAGHDYTYVINTINDFAPFRIA